MTNIIEAIEKQLQAQKDDIYFQQVQIENLKKQLAEAEEDKTALLQQLSVAESEIGRLKGATA